MLLNWYGCKAQYLHWLAPLLPAARTYVEPFGGTAAVLRAREPAETDVYGEADPRLIAFFRLVAEDAPGRAALVDRLASTPYHHLEWARARERMLADPTDVLAFVIYNRQRTHNRPSTAKRIPGGSAWKYRYNLTVAPTIVPEVWLTGFVDDLGQAAARMARARIVEQDGLRTAQDFDGPETLHYLDPPYVGFDHDYAYDERFDEAAHRRLLAGAQALRGRVAISGYRSPLYDAALGDGRWLRFDGPARDRPERREALWTNYLP